MLDEAPRGRGCVIHAEEPGRKGVVEVGGVVGDLVGQVDQLRLERGLLAGQVLVQLR